MLTVAEASGLRAERLEMPPHGLSAEDSAETFEHKSRIARRKAAALLRQKMTEGAVILTDGGWRVQTEESFTAWCWWGILTKAKDDGDIRGACLRASTGNPEGYRNRPLDYLGGCWAISLDEPTLDGDEVALVALNQAVARIRGTGQYAMTERSVYGLEAMDAWIAQMTKVPFCTACAHAGVKGMAGCAANNAETTRSAATVAAAYLRRQGCQRATGTLKAPFVTVAAGSFALTSGELSQFRAKSGERCDAHGVWHFCPRCGTQILWQAVDGDQRDLFAGTLDDAAAIFQPTE